MIQLGYSLADTRQPRQICALSDGVDLVATPEHALKAYNAAGDCSGLVHSEPPTWFTWRACTCTEDAALLQLAEFQAVPQRVLAARLVLDLPDFRWTDEKGEERKGLPREEQGGLWLVTDAWLKQNLWAKHQAFVYTVGRLALATGPSDLEKKAS